MDRQLAPLSLLCTDGCLGRGGSAAAASSFSFVFMLWMALWEEWVPLRRLLLLSFS